jgi:hypothetical protein
VFSIVFVLEFNYALGALVETGVKCFSHLEMYSLHHDFSAKSIGMCVKHAFGVSKIHMYTRKYNDCFRLYRPIRGDCNWFYHR